jgi:2,4-dienoyl-CoA reductase-like NADH-dependent reductase (Old Yellow Enzyme family)
MSCSDPLLEPFDLRHLRLTSRIVSASHATAYAEDSLPKERYLRYHLEKAKGGVALTMLGGASCVSPESPAFVNNIALYRDDVVPHFRRLSDALHEYGTAVMCQVTHAGRRTSNYAAQWLPVISASRVPEAQHKAVPKVAEDWDIERAVEAFADGVERCRAGGLDGVELLGVGHLLDQFWSPATNRRDDEWGGDFERRLRFPIEVLRAIRRRVGDDFVVGARIAVDEQLPDGLTTADGVELVRRLTGEGLDFLSLVRGGYDSDDRLGRVIPPMGTPLAPHLAFAGDVKRQVGIPVLHAGRIRDLDTARAAIRQKQVDLIGMVRPLIAEPYLVRHLREGTPERIRPSVGSGYGIDRIYQGLDLVDIGNAAVGREGTLPHIVPRADSKKTVVVVGAGIAGLEAVRTLAERGHRVIAFEATDRPGGQVALAASVPRRRELFGLIDWRLREIARLHAPIRYRTPATAALVRAAHPDVVIIATGGVPHVGVIGGDVTAITDGWKVLAGEIRPTGSVLVFDGLGDHPALAVVEILADEGADLELVTPDRAIGIRLGATNYPPYLRKFAEKAVRMTLTTRVTEVTRREDGRLTVALVDEFADIRTTRVVDHVVVELGTTPVDDLYFQLKPDSSNGGAVDQAALIDARPQTVVRNPSGAFQLFRVGDAVSSRNIPAAVLDAYRLGLAI